jgi:hypothetical protein
MINLDRVQECRPLHLTHPTPCHGRFSSRRWQSGRSSLDRKIAPVTSQSYDESHRRKYVKLQVWTMRMPFVDPRLADGRRFHAVLGTPPSPGTRISLRVPAGRSFSVEDCVASGSLTPGDAQFLSRMIEARLAFLISGGIGSGTRGPRAVKALVRSVDHLSPGDYRKAAGACACVLDAIRCQIATI